MEKVKIADAGRCKNCKEWIPRDIINVIEQHKCPVCGIINPIKPLSIVETIAGLCLIFGGIFLFGLVILIGIIFIVFLFNVLN